MKRMGGKEKVGTVFQLLIGWHGVISGVRLFARNSYPEWKLEHLYPQELNC